MGSCVLVAGCIRFHYVPIEQREDLVEAGVAVQVGVVEVGKAAVAELDVRRNQREFGLAGLTDSIVVLIEEGRSVDVRLSLVGGYLAHIYSCSAGYPYGRGKAVDQHIVPLIEHSDAPVAIGQAGQFE